MPLLFFYCVLNQIFVCPQVSVSKCTFGGSTVECSNFGKFINAANCAEAEFDFVYTVKNTGSTICKLDSIVGESKKNLVSLATPNPFSSGQSSQVTDVVTMNVCNGASIAFPVVATAHTPPNGKSTTASTNFSLKLPGFTHHPTSSPTQAPTIAVVPTPTKKPTKRPTSVPTTRPSLRPPTNKPTPFVYMSPTNKPTPPIYFPPTATTASPTKKPTLRPTAKPTSKPTVMPTQPIYFTPPVTSKPTVAPVKPSAPVKPW